MDYTLYLSEEPQVNTATSIFHLYFSYISLIFQFSIFRFISLDKTRSTLNLIKASVVIIKLLLY